MDADERLTALKKAYADIILNTAKEAASRIMVSERKALRFQHELCLGKDEALQMLLRLKKMMDSKISEAEMTSLNQQKKIEELEAQLQEAEDIVRDLREELREVHVELERVRRNKVQHPDEHDLMIPQKALEENSLFASQSVFFHPQQSQHDFIAAQHVINSNFNHRIDVHKCYNRTMHMGNSYLGNHDIPSIILRNKEPELYRNGCTQRIRACERNLLNGEANDAKLEISTKEDEQGERICTTLTQEANKESAVETKVVQGDGRLHRYLARVADCTCRKRRKAAKLKKNKSLRYRKISNQFTKSDQAPDVSLERTHLTYVDTQSGQDHHKMAPILTSDRIMPSECTKRTESEFVKNHNVDDEMKKDKLLVDEIVATTQEGCSTDNSEVPACTRQLETVDVPSVNLEESKASDTTVPCHPVNDRIIKYTFQRKRKREASSISDGIASPEKCTVKRRVEEKHNNSLKPQKSSLMTESSRNSRRLAQVARQLISLSEKKWWQ